MGEAASLFFQFDMLYFNTGFLQQINAVRQSVASGVDYAHDAGLNDELGAFYARRIGNVERGTVRVVSGAGNFCDGIGFGVQYVGQCQSVFPFAHIGKAGGGAFGARLSHVMVMSQIWGQQSRYQGFANHSWADTVGALEA